MNIAFIISGVVLGYALYTKTQNLLTSIIIGLVIATLRDKTGRILKGRKKPLCFAKYPTTNYYYSYY